jgi:hypothetical protein
MNQETVDFVNNCFLIFFGIYLIVIIGAFLWWFRQWIKDILEIKRIRKENFIYIKQYEYDNPHTKAYENAFDWEWKHHYRNNYRNNKWCSMCKYWVEIEDGTEYEYCRGICKIRYKQYMNVEESTTTNDWCCKYFK